MSLDSDPDRQASNSSPKIAAIQDELFAPGRSKAERYAQLVIGRTSLWTLMKYELIVTGCSWVPGAIGFLLRSKLYPFLLGRVGDNVTFGVNVV